jgi:hypothetical protein
MIMRDELSAEVRTQVSARRGGGVIWPRMALNRESHEQRRERVRRIERQIAEFLREQAIKPPVTQSVFRRT